MSAGGFDVGVHISEEAWNASVAVPWAIISVTAIGCILGFAIQISVAFCMGPDTLSILSDPVQQPMATVESFIIIFQICNNQYGSDSFK
jgi:amino acid transporter